MTKILKTILFMFVCYASAVANEFVVQSFEIVGNDISARRFERRDVNDSPCALIKIRTDVPKPFVIDANLGIEGNIEFKENNEIWVYVSEGERQLTIAKDGFVTLKYAIPQMVESLSVYSLILKAKDNKVTVVFISRPDDAEKFIDGKSLGTGSSYDIEMGEHQLEIKKEGYDTYSRNIVINESNKLFKNIELSVIEPTQLTINSNPSGASIILNNVDEGRTDKTLIKMPGIYSIQIIKNKYESIDDTIAVTSNGQNIWTYQLSKAVGILSIVTTPADAEVSINGQALPNNSKELGPGNYQIKASKAGWNSLVENMYMVKGEDKELVLNLTQKTGSLELTVEPINTQVIFDRKGLILETWTGSIYKKDIPVGDYSVHLSAPGYKEELRSFEIDGINSTKLNIALKKFIYVKSRKKAMWRSAVFPGLGQLYEDRGLVGGIYIVGQASLIYLFTTQRSEYDKLQQEYLVKRKDYTNFRGSQEELSQRWDTAQRAYEASEDVYRKQQVTIGLIAGTYLWNIADAWLFMPRRTQSNWSTGVNADGKSISAHVEVSLP